MSRTPKTCKCGHNKKAHTYFGCKRKNCGCGSFQPSYFKTVALEKKDNTICEVIGCNKKAYAMCGITLMCRSHYNQTR